MLTTSLLGVSSSCIRLFMYDNRYIRFRQQIPTVPSVAVQLLWWPDEVTLVVKTRTLMFESNSVCFEREVKKHE
jgi:hypothetical protein